VFSPIGDRPDTYRHWELIRDRRYRHPAFPREPIRAHAPTRATWPDFSPAGSILPGQSPRTGRRLRDVNRDVERGLPPAGSAPLSLFLPLAFGGYRPCREPPRAASYFLGIPRCFLYLFQPRSRLADEPKNANVFSGRHLRSHHLVPVD
jgi:hypothetical protein